VTFFDELKRRKVYRVAVAYVIVAGGIIQLGSAVFPAWQLPDWTLRVTVVLLLAGFPIALVLAWAFDVTPQGIQATPAVASPATGGSNRRRNIFLLAALGIVFSAATGFFLLPRAAAHRTEKSIAVLPFQNLSEEKENAFFADGIQDDILTNLAKIGDLKVISRTSVMAYRDKPASLREIGKTLGVSAILEGSVRKVGNRVRVNVQLINAENDQHLWAEDYDRELTDVFAIQTDLAQKIAKELRAQLSPAEKEQIMRKPTENGEAYLAFMQANNLFAIEDFEKLKQSEQMYERAITLDPQFALAFARYSQLESWIVHSFGRTPERQQKARVLAERAMQLQPDLPEAHLALGFVHYYIENDFDAAAREFEIARRGLPNKAEVYLAIGAIQRRQGRWAESNASFEKAVALNPKDTWTAQNLAHNYQAQRNFEAANKTIDRALAIDPKSIFLLEFKANLAIEESGDLGAAEKSLADIKATPESPLMQAKLVGQRINLLVLRRKFDEAGREMENLPDSVLADYPGALRDKYSGLGIFRKVLHDEVGAREALLKAKGLAEDEIKQNPEDATIQAGLAEVLAWLGEKEAALAAIKRARELLPESKDAYGGADVTFSEARIRAILGDATGAVAILDGLLQRPSPVTVALLKIHPLWDFIRSDPGFQALIDKYDAKT
jgi:TolB-like protein/Tfp pilus assembly protein PilF